MKALATLSLVLIFLPVIFQYIYGNRSVNNKTTLSFQMITTASLVAHIVLTFASMFLTNSTIIEEEGKYACAMPIGGIIIISGFLFAVLLLILVVQSNRKG